MPPLHPILEVCCFLQLPRMLPATLAAVIGSTVVLVGDRHKFRPRWECFATLAKELHPHARYDKDLPVLNKYSCLQNPSVAGHLPLTNPALAVSSNPALGRC
jgi:hypothetical protein